MLSFFCLGNSLLVNANLNMTLLHTDFLDPVYIIHSILTTVWNMCSTDERISVSAEIEFMPFLKDWGAGKALRILCGV